MQMQIPKEWDITHHQAFVWLASAYGAALDWAAGGLLTSYLLRAAFSSALLAVQNP